MLRLSIPGKTTDIGDPQRCNYFVALLRSSLKTENELEALLETAHRSVATSTLKNILAGYSVQVHRQAIRFEEIFGILLMQPGGATFAAIRNLQKEVQSLKQEINALQLNERSIRNCLLKINQYKIVLYSNLEQLSASLGMNDITCLLQEASDEEKATGFLLTETSRTHMRASIVEA